MCKSWCECILAVIIIVFALLPNWAGSQWILLIAGILLLWHSFTCKTCFVGRDMDSGVKARRRRK